MQFAFRRHAFSPVAMLLAVGCLAGAAGANPVLTTYTDELNCDSLITRQFDEELGNNVGFTGNFPGDEEILVQSSLVEFATCGHAADFENDWVVDITNVTPYDFEDLFFVVNTDLSFANYDGKIKESAAVGEGGLAMRIDGTVTSGINNPLISESFNVDEIFESGETWSFLVVDFSAGADPGNFTSLGVAHAGGPSTASIVAIQVIPEPTSALLLGAGLAGLAFQGRRRYYQP